MKTLLGILFVIQASNAFAQFPPPTNFQFSYEYISSHYCPLKTS